MRSRTAVGSVLSENRCIGIGMPSVTRMLRNLERSFSFVKGKGNSGRRQPMGDWYKDKSLTSHVEVYNNEKDFKKEASKAAKEGWQPSQIVTGEGHINRARTVGRAVLTGGLGLMVTGRSRSKGKITVSFLRGSELEKASATVGNSESSDPAVQLATYANLVERGLMTREEFEAQKQRLLE